MDHTVTVQVALRIRPLVENELNRGCRNCLRAIPNENQIQVVGTDKAFTFNYVFDETTNQQQFYDIAIKEMCQKLFKGYNVTVLAYGQTGSGKTYSMGTNYDGRGEMGVIPRIVGDIFGYIEEQKDTHEFQVHVSFMELYKETLFDLLSKKPREQCVVDIREDSKGIKIPGLLEQPVKTPFETFQYLIEGSSGRATAATAMNSRSSRSHAIFTLHISMQKKGDANSATTSKFHLVDLAGSERPKKTKATGERFKEGVDINRGLLALGNVISALGEENQKGFISYRDSKLTRLLQDSLGGNSITLMIACASPADYNLEETLSTLRYADRARKIKNKPIVNQDPRAAEIARLNRIIQEFRLEKLAGGTCPCSNGDHDSNEVSRLREENAKLSVKARELSAALYTCLAEKTTVCERMLVMEDANEKLRLKLRELQDNCEATLSNLTGIIEPADKERLDGVRDLISELNCEQKRATEEVQRLEYLDAKEEEQSGSEKMAETSVDVDERQESHAREQLILNKELQTLNRELALKEQLASQMAANSLRLIDPVVMQETEVKMAALEKERDELMQQLKGARAHTVSSKLAEQRRVRVKELETAIGELRRKVSEQARLIKLREKDEVKIKQLNTEIVQMKAGKVKLIRAMRTEEQKFRTWRQQKEKDLIRLKEQDRKREHKMQKMATTHQKQQAVLKRKVEEAAAINKRLKDALQLQRQAQEHRGRQQPEGERVLNWITREIELLESAAEARHTLQGLMEDRALLSRDLDSCTSEHDEQLRQQLQDEVDLRNAQIADLQQKIVDLDLDGRSKTRFDALSTMAEVKAALRLLFERLTEDRSKSVNLRSKLRDQKAALEEKEIKVVETERLLKERELQHKENTSRLERDYEDKVSLILAQLRAADVVTDDDALARRFQLQEEHCRRLEIELEELKATIAKINSVANTTLPKKPAAAHKKQPRQYLLHETISIESDEDEISNDDENDPDWQRTPLFKRSRIMRSNGNDSSSAPVKRSSDSSVRCTCKGNCSTKVCGCRKLGVSCNDNCKCKSCYNKSAEQSTTTFKYFRDEESGTDDSMKRSRPLSDADSRPAKQTKIYFKSDDDDN